jgi:osmoprotectant transport system permease protein
VSDELALLPGYLLGHMQLSLLALVTGALFSIPLGVLAARRPRLESWVLGVAAVAQTIPSLALLALMVPLLAALGAWTATGLGVELRSIGFLPAWLALSLYSVLPMLRNTVTGIAGVDPALIEAARGVGMTPRQRLLQVELPLALPVIVAGVRTATVWVVGTATLATPVGATSLGNFIFSGLQTRNYRAVLVGSVSSALLALVLDALVHAVERGLVARRRSLWLGALAVLAALGLGVGGISFARADVARRPIAIGAKAFTEQYVLAALLEQTVRDAGAERVRRVDSLGSTVAFDALRDDEIDLYVDYSGTIWATILGGRGLPGDRASVLAEVREGLAERYGIAVVAALGFENTYAIAMREDRAAALGIETLGELARYAPRLSIGGDYEFFARAEWKALEERYGLRFATQRSMDPALMYTAVAQGEVDAISAFSTDGRIAALGLRLLRDELAVIPPYDAIVLAGPRLQRERPALLRAVAALAGSIDEAQMQRMNGAVDRDGESPASVAARFRAEVLAD